MTRYVMAIDQGTTGSTVVILDDSLNICAKANFEFPQIYPQAGWVEHNPEAIWTSVSNARREIVPSPAGNAWDTFPPIVATFRT